MREELEALKDQVSKLVNSSSIEGDLHKGLSDVEQLVSECEAGVKSIKQATDALEKKIDTLEKNNKQADESAVSRMASQLSELDEAMEVRENENAALDGRVEKMEQHAEEMSERVAGLQTRMDDLAHQCKLLNDQTQQLDDYVVRNSVTKDEFVKVQGALDNTASKSDLARVADKIGELDDRSRQRDVGGAGSVAGSVTARSLHSEKDGSFSEFHDELAVASEGSARIRALAARVRGVTQSGTSVNASPIGAPRGAAADTVLSPSQITSPRSMLEETAERIREWEVRNQGLADKGSDDDSHLQFV
jgi:DNA repair exonuclease SbcCD ATPase subunit